MCVCVCPDIFHVSHHILSVTALRVHGPVVTRRLRFASISPFSFFFSSFCTVSSFPASLMLYSLDEWSHREPIFVTCGVLPLNNFRLCDCFCSYFAFFSLFIVLSTMSVSCPSCVFSLWSLRLHATEVVCIHLLCF